MDDSYFNSRTSRDEDRQTAIVLFGSQVTNWTHEDTSALQHALQVNPDLGFLKLGLESLELLVSILDSAEFDTTLHHDAFKENIRLIKDTLAGKINPDPRTLGNTITAPLTVASHVRDLLKLAQNRDALGSDNLKKVRSYQGFCIGFLSSAAFSVSKSRSEFEHNVLIALRLATLIGMVVDAENASHPNTNARVAIAARCKTPLDRENLDMIMNDFPRAYVSCVTDELVFTITLGLDDKVSFISRLSKANIAITEIGLQGSYHTPIHAKTATALRKLCANNVELRFPEASSLRLPLRSSIDTEIITSGWLSDVAIDSILCKRAHWAQVVKRSVFEATNVQYIPIGPEPCIPRSLLASAWRHTIGNPRIGDPVEEIAVVGMACRFPQADSVDEFWELISSGQSALATVPGTRFQPTGLNRGPKLDAYWGNFISQPDVFDHRFFGISGREARSMDPQQRLALQVAYEALESSGYHSLLPSNKRKDVGCYLGVGSVDYEDNVASEDANAFSATGTLRAFISGRINHFFDWSGPSITFDTACSSSAVAIHTACRALLGKECSMALAGGVNVITSPKLQQNLSSASFLNPDGSSRAFDNDANGYCRGEGAGIIVLKPLSHALREGDNIMAVIVGSAINQNSNKTSITVPDSQSQSDLYRRVLSMGRIRPEMVSYVEAHGTGTSIGDPIEYESIRSALCDKKRERFLFLGSVKDNIGHTEAASGAAGVIKTLLMIQREAIPKQANFTSLNSRIRDPSNMILIPKHTQPWLAEPKVALVNNYGAAGSNAAISIREHKQMEYSHEPPRGKFPIIVSARSKDSLERYVGVLKSYLAKTSASLGTVAHNVSKRQNPSFYHRAAFTAPDLGTAISSLENFQLVDKTEVVKEGRPVILAFGGQTGQCVCLSKELYDESDLLQKHVRDCDAVCLKLNLPSMLPAIFQDKTTDDIVLLHCMLLTLQYSCAKSFIESGLKVDAMIGHSFGQIIALCVAGSISLEDTFRFISTRALLIRDKWCSDHGVMLAVECSRREIEAIVARVKEADSLRVDIACYNGPSSFVLSGSTPSIDMAEKECVNLKSTYLSNTHAYHSYKVDVIMSDLDELARTIDVRPPQIHVETCSELASWLEFTANKLVQHTRQPVYFFDALQRLSSCFPSAIWLEAGSATPIIAMTRHALRESQNSGVYLPMNLCGSEAKKNLSETICQLWISDIPPYQFEKHSQWIDLKTAQIPPYHADGRYDLATLIRVGSGSNDHVFLINTTSTLFDLAARGHAVAGQGLCPASMYIEMAAQCVSQTCKDLSEVTLLPRVEELVMNAPLTLSASCTVSLRLRQAVEGSWEFSIYSSTHQNSDITKHANGIISLASARSSITEYRLGLLQKLTRFSRAERIFDSGAAKGVSGPLVYKIFSDVVNYAEYYRGVKKISAIDYESAGIVALSPEQSFGSASTLCDPISLDNFLQVAGIHVNCLSDRDSDEVFMCTAIEEIIFLGPLVNAKVDQRSWYVYSQYDSISKFSMRNNIFIYASSSKQLALVIIGATFKKVPFKLLLRSFSRLNAQPTNVRHSKVGDDSHTQDSGYLSTESPMSEVGSTGFNLEYPADSQLQAADTHKGAGDNTGRKRPTPHQIESVASVEDVSRAISRILEIPIHDVEPSSTLDELGVDSLLSTELLSDLQKEFHVKMSQTELQKCNNVQQLYSCIQGGPRNENSIYKMTDDAHELESYILRDLVGNPELEPTNRSHIDEEVTISRQTYDRTVISHHRFLEVKSNYDRHAEHTGFADFYKGPWQLQSRLVLQYVVEALSSMNIGLEALKEGERLPSIRCVPRHEKLIPQLLKILEEAGIIQKDSDNNFHRTKAQTQAATSEVIYREMLEKYPQHASETKLLHTTASKLAACLLGSTDPLALIFKDTGARALLEDVYTNAPMFKAGNLLLADYIVSIIEEFDDGHEIRILEIGAGTGGTTRYIVDKLAISSSQRHLSYTFTDVSSSLVAAARRKFSKWDFMQYAVLDIEKEPPTQFLDAYDIIISTNCIHATKDLVRSATNVRRLLRADGMLCLVELTRNLFWFDLVFGLLEGWWLFTDGREHVLAHEKLWQRTLLSAGFSSVQWTEGVSEESSVLRVIAAWKSQSALIHSASSSEEISRNGFNDNMKTRETLVHKKIDDLDLLADIYYPEQLADVSTPRPVGKQFVLYPSAFYPITKTLKALMIHGGGHVMLSRNDIREEQTQLLLDNGFLPVSIDYRLCPEKAINEGPIPDVIDALAWIRQKLPGQRLLRSDIKVDGERVVAVGWSTGGHPAMTLSWTSASRGIKAPDAILAFYNPSDYEDPCWINPNYPSGSTTENTGYNLDDEIWSGICGNPITRYNVPRTESPIGGWLAPRDPRSRLLLYMNRKGRTLNVLLRGMRKGERSEPATPSPAEVAAISPLSHIRNGSYNTPTFLIHTRKDDLVPWTQAERTYVALRDQGIDAELRLLEKGPHLFDITREFRTDKVARQAVSDGYRFLCQHARLPFRGWGPETSKSTK
ncbi:hypothetical protein F5Y10DRAFT_262854 [Nemania abortiva]|nr:hypothetical protein F5Y10DRAFT_262854 [Nemania abortiva]